MTVLTRRALIGAAPVALAGAAVVAHPSVAHALEPSGGTLVLVTPFRLHDSRGADGTGAKYQIGDTPAITVPDLATVHGVVLNVTLTDTEGTGFLRVAENVEWPAPTSTINWYADNQVVANLAIVHTHNEASKVYLQFGGKGGKTHVVLDVIGYIS